MRRNTPLRPLDTKDEQLLYALLRARKKHEAAGMCGQSVSTMYRALADPRFMAAYRTARRAMFDEAMSTLERNADDSALVLVELAADKMESSKVRLSAAKAVLDRAFKARNSVGMEEEVAGLRAIIEALEANTLPAAWETDEPERVPPVVNNEQAEAALARAEWMGELGMPGDAIAYSLRYNRPQSLVEEQELLDAVRKQVEWERSCEEAMRTCT